MKIFRLILSLMLLSQLLVAQTGDLPLTHYEVPIPPQDYKFRDMQIDFQGRLLVAYNKGVLQYDGESWLNISIESSPIKFLTIDKQCFLLAKDGVYQLVEDQFNRNTFTKVLGVPLLSTMVDLLDFGGQYYLLASNEITVFNRQFQMTNSFTSMLGFKDVFVFEDRLFAFEDNFLVENIDSSWVDLNLYAPEDTDFIFSINGEDKLYFAYDNGDFYSFDGKEFLPYSKAVNEYSRANYPISGKFFDGKLIISTLSGGVIMVDEKSGEIISTVQKYNGLPTNEVSAITMDHQRGLWLAHPYGLSRAALGIPLKDFQFYPGLEGYLEALITRNDTLWVGTSEGLFFLEEVKDFETFQQRMLERVKVSQPMMAERKQEDNFFQNVFGANQESYDQGLVDELLKKHREIYRNEGFRFLSLKRKLKEKEEFLIDSLNQNSKKRTTGRSPSEPAKYKTVVRTVDISRLKSIDYEYRKIKEVTGHVESILGISDGILVQTTTGIYKVKNGITTKISSLRMAQKLIYQSAKNTLWVTSPEGLFKIDLNRADYLQSRESAKQFIDLAIEKNMLAAVGENILEVFEIKDEGLKKLKGLSITNRFSEEPAVYFDEGMVKVLRSDGIMRLELESGELSIDSVFSPALKYFLKDQDENIWLLSNDDLWRTLLKNIPRQVRDWMQIVPPIRSIAVESDSIIYFVSNERILRWKQMEMQEYITPNTFIDGVMIDNKWVEDKGFVQMEHDENKLKISLSTPEYLFRKDVTYQYFVKGLMDEWSSWSSVREIDFPYIPTGNYMLEIRVKNFLDDDIQTFDFKFEVLPPYWQTWWFYMLEMAFFSILILISIRLNTTNQSSYLTKTFTFLTLILFLELFGTILENNLQGYLDDSPVYDFAINVLLAVSISPIEKAVSRMLILMKSAKSKELIKKMRERDKEIRDK